MSGAVFDPPFAMRLPSGLSPIWNFLTKAWLTIATLGAPALSALVNSRPAMSGIPIVLKNPGPTPLNEAEVLVSGPLTVVRAVVDCGSRQLAVIGVHLSAVVAKGGYRSWRSEMSELTTFVATLTPPFVLIGDFNSSRFRPEFAKFVRGARLTDVHGGVGKGLTRSLKLSDRGVFAQVPAFTRVDHALLSTGVHAVDVRNLPTLGSDHHPFVATLAVQPDPAPKVRPVSSEAGT